MGFDAIKAKIVASPDFKKETIAMSAVMGCSGVRKSQNCAAYVEEAAFCLAFADQLGRFQNMTGVAVEKTYCENIDKKLPQLSLFLQSRKAPVPKANSFMENAEVAEIKRAVFRALTRLRAATIKEFDTIARLETQAIDAYNDAHHYRAENPLAHLHEDEAPVETDKLKSFH